MIYQNIESNILFIKQNNKQMKVNLLIISLLLVICSCRELPVEEYSIIPQPVEITYTQGQFKLKKSPAIAYPAELSNEAQLLQSYLSEDFSLQVKLREGKKSTDITLQLSSTVTPDEKEGYILDVTSGGILIKANSPAGILNGIQSLRQIIKSKNGRYVVRKAVITDYPAFSWRAFMLDEGRHFKGKNVVFDLLDNMAELKMNVFHWGLTNDQGWRIEINKYPKLTEIGAFRDSTEINHFHSNIFDGKPHGGFYTQAELKEVVEYAAKRHIMVVPEINMPGHASAAIAAYPWLGTSGEQIKVPTYFGVMYDIYNVADPKVLQFLEDVIDEVTAIFPAPIIHVGGDEVRYDHWRESPFIRAYMAKNKLNTPTDLQIHFTNNISKMLAAKKRRMMGWNEITGAKLHEYQPEADTKVEQQLAEGTVVHFWKGDPTLMKQVIEMGYDVVNSTHDYTYLDYPYESISLEKAYSFNPVLEGLTAEQSKKILGLGCQMWCEFVPTVERLNYQVYPRLAAYAETGWTQMSNKNYECFQKRLNYFFERWKSKGVEYGFSRLN